MEAFSIDKFSGVLSMVKSLDRELGEAYELHNSASDQAHQVKTTVDIIVEDIKNFSPEFIHHVYLRSFSSNMSL